MRPRNLEKEDAIRKMALQIISEEGLENLSMQRLAKAANVSPRTIYIKYKDKDDFLIKLFIDEVIVVYEKAVLDGFNEQMDFAAGVQLIWQNTFRFFKSNRPYFALMQYGKSSPLLNKAFQERNIREGQFFTPIHLFLTRHATNGVIGNFPGAIYRALLFSPVLDLVNEYFDHTDRPVQIITEETVTTCAQMIIKGMIL
jgi:TetR/AcrR family transcriptional repressor of multidrug resistance operon